jgi:hypothetical protein
MVSGCGRIKLKVSMVLKGDITKLITDVYKVICSPKSFALERLNLMGLKVSVSEELPQLCGHLEFVEEVSHF